MNKFQKLFAQERLIYDKVWITTIIIVTGVVLFSMWQTDTLFAQPTTPIISKPVNCSNAVQDIAIETKAIITKQEEYRKINQSYTNDFGDLFQKSAWKEKNTLALDHFPQDSQTTIKCSMHLTAEPNAYSLTFTVRQ